MGAPGSTLPSMGGGCDAGVGPGMWSPAAVVAVGRTVAVAGTARWTGAVRIPVARTD